MSKNKIVRSVSFNKLSERDQERMKLIGKKAFSTYMKKLLDDEIKRQKERMKKEEVPVQPQVPSHTAKPQPQQQVIPQQPKPDIYKIYNQKQSQRQYQSQPQYYPHPNPMLRGR